MVTENITPIDHGRQVMPSPPTREECERLAAVDGLNTLCQQFGYRRVLRWVKNLAAMHGEEV